MLDEEVSVEGVVVNIKESSKIHILLRNNG
jgi:hypothetical protein